MADQWFYTHLGSTYGPVDIEHLRELIGKGVLEAADAVSNDPVSEFKPLISIDQFRAAITANLGAGVLSYRANVGGVDFTAKALASLRRTRMWVLVHGILAFVIAGIMAAAIIITAFAASREGGQDSLGQTLVVIVEYLVFGIVYEVIGRYLLRYAARIRTVVSTGAPRDLETAIDTQHGCWKFLTIALIFYLGLYLVTTVIALVSTYRTSFPWGL